MLAWRFTAAFSVAANEPAYDYLNEVKPKDALTIFEVPKDFPTEIVASEPTISDPVAMEIDENGVMYVVERHRYPLYKSGTGQVRILGDADGDMKMDNAAIFAETLRLSTEIMR